MSEQVSNSPKKAPYRAITTSPLQLHNATLASPSNNHATPRSTSPATSDYRNNHLPSTYSGVSVRSCRTSTRSLASLADDPRAVLAHHGHAQPQHTRSRPRSISLASDDGVWIAGQAPRDEGEREWYRVRGRELEGRFDDPRWSYGLAEEMLLLEEEEKKKNGGEDEDGVRRKANSQVRSHAAGESVLEFRSKARTSREAEGKRT
ncbi:Pre-rRNA processing protein Utp22 [Neofusicoccum parvum]|nr:Pre-rRNA processing protein Utp22 [Neofusicoccum parvum]